MSLTQQYRHLCLPEQFQNSVLREVELDANGFCLTRGALRGLAALPPVDSGEGGFVWDRLKLSAEIPAEAGLRVYARASDEEAWPEWDRFGDAPDPSEWLREQFGAPVGAGTDLLLPCRGRYLWLVLELAASGESPVVHSLALREGGDHMTDYLPAIYQGEDFTYRFLSIFNSMFQDMEAAVENLPRQLDPNSVSDEMLQCLARWLCVGPEDGSAQLRERLPHILDEYELMYTPEGVRRTVKRLTGRTPQLIEHFMVDPNDPDCPDPELYRRLYGEDPYRLFVLLPDDTFSGQGEMERFLKDMAELLPAEIDLELVLLKPGVDLDGHTYLGMDTRIGERIAAVLDESTPIHYNTTIGGTQDERQQ